MQYVHIKITITRGKLGEKVRKTRRSSTRRFGSFSIYFAFSCVVVVYIASSTVTHIFVLLLWIGVVE